MVRTEDLKGRGQNWQFPKQWLKLMILKAVVGINSFKSRGRNRRFWMLWSKLRFWGAWLESKILEVVVGIGIF